MKTARRQELRTNELSQQIDQITEYAKQNAIRLIAIFAVTFVVVVGAFWYIRNQQTRREDAWAALSDSTLAEEPQRAVRRFEEIAAAAGDVDLRIAARLRIGDLALAQMEPTPAKNDSAEDAESFDWQTTARNAYTKVADEPNADPVSAGHAMLMLGILDENAGDDEEAKTWYERVTQDRRLDDTPLPEQAKYRLAGLSRWSEPVVFAEPAPTVPMPRPEDQILGGSQSPIDLSNVFTPPPDASATEADASSDASPGADSTPQSTGTSSGSSTVSPPAANGAAPPTTQPATP